jgi:hypothetical protein
MGIDSDREHLIRIVVEEQFPGVPRPVQPELLPSWVSPTPRAVGGGCIDWV